MKRNKLFLLLLVGLGLGAFFALDGDDLLELEFLRAQLDNFHSWFDDSPWLMAGGFFLIYVAAAGLSLPGAALLTLLAGALFGLGKGLLIASFASTIGATLAFLMSRTLLRDTIEKRFKGALRSVNRGLERDGSFYLFSLRLVPIFPFFVVNLAMGVTRLKTLTFYWVSQLGMLPGTAVYANAGKQLSTLESLEGILSPELLFSLILLGLFPLVGKKIVDGVNRRRQRRHFSRPRHFDYDIVVIGAGSAGLVASYIASAIKARVALVEQHRMGGDCLNTGCVPSKALIRAARAAHEVRTASRFGVHAGEPRIDFADVMAHVHEAIAKVAPHDSAERYTQLGVDVIEAQATLESPWVVRAGERRLTARHVVIATGARPRLPDLPGLENVEVLTSENLWALDTLPERLAILGGGAIGCELGQSFARLGSQVTLVEGGPRLLAKEDDDVSDLIRQRLSAEGVTVHTDTRAVSVETDEKGQHALIVERDGTRHEIPFDRLLVCVGRQANVEGLGLESLGVLTTDQGTLEINDYLQTRCPNVWACGDVCGPFQLTHAGAHQAWHATVNALFGNLKRFAVDYRVIPVVTYTQPEVARVGLNERQARSEGIEYEVTHYALHDNDRAITEGATEGFVKVLTEPGKDRILGATLVGENAGEWLAELTLAMKRRTGLNKLLGTVHPYPTLSEASKSAAGQWKNAHKPERLLRWLERYFAWRRHSRRQ
ncbi:dihydrolipoamide dehydrogenase [Modicisalibacter xianhensis]|uniref:Dihydrolipoamide dehydrogenase n=1 Tax=Modicisalibacter xianhensis TaxID=442341 RepID=A0A4R8G856_9GAMM|nr:FAD-dependent oxidoreductase [Halomonas xianhensis]TDX32848.1 dihydrolipoamide dehydrogenase [Halomonas xianhensis]